MRVRITLALILVVVVMVLLTADLVCRIEPRGVMGVVAAPGYNCVFDNIAVVGDYVVRSRINSSECHDTGVKGPIILQIDAVR